MFFQLAMLSARARIIWRLGGDMALDAFITDWEIAIESPRSRLHPAAKKQIGQFCHRMRRKYGLEKERFDKDVKK